MKKTILLASLLSAGTLVSSAIATNYALRLEAAGSVDCGAVAALDNAKSYTIQFWLNPSSWTSRSNIISFSEDCNICEGADNTLLFSCAEHPALQIKSDAIAVGKWAQITIISDGQNTRALVNGTEVASGELITIPASNNLTLGNGFEGRLDEVRLWTAPVSDEHFYFVNNTVNRWNPQVDDLAVYYKFDNPGCENIVDLTEIWHPGEGTNNHGVRTAEGTSFEAVTDNEPMKYRINGAYTANERFYDRAIPRNQYLLSNDLINLGIQSFKDGHLEYCTPVNDATIEGVKALAEYQGRTTVADFDGNASMNCGNDLFNELPVNWFISFSMYIDKWVEGAVLFSKANADNTKGITVSLGDEALKAFCITIDGHKYQANKKVEDGKWQTICIKSNINPTLATESVYLGVNGKSVTINTRDSSTEICNKPTTDNTMTAIIGKNFVGKLDDMLFAKYGFSIDQSQQFATNGPMMPGVGKSVTADIFKNVCAAYLFEDPADLGYDSWSQENWRKIMESAYEGHEGWESRISVKTPQGYNDGNLYTLINNATWRANFARDLAVLSAPYDGVELDLEWVYDYTNYGKLAQLIRESLPEGKSFFISLHNVAYKFPTDKMQYVDGFTFQQYGPQNQHFAFSHFKNMCNTFVNWGFPKEKIIGSYATTTSKGYKNGSATTPISGVRSGAFDVEDYTPNAERDAWVNGDYTFYYTGPLQTRNRAKHIVDNQMGGIFYWDMGNDVPVEHQYNLAKWASYGLNSNVEPIVKEAPAVRTQGVEDVAAAKKGHDLALNGGYLTCTGSLITVYTLQGVQVAQAADALNVDTLPAGIYLATANGKSLKFIK